MLVKNDLFFLQLIVRSFILKLSEHLKFDKVPQNYTVMIGNPVTLECQVEGPLNPQVTWYKVHALIIFTISNYCRERENK